MTMDALPLFVGVAKAAQISGLSQKAIRERLKTGQIAYLPGNGGKFLVNRVSLLEYLDAESRRNRGSGQNG